MAQIIVRGIDDELMKAFRERARTRGVSAEQAVRELIEASAREAERQAGWYAQATAVRERIQAKYGILLPGAAESIREDRDAR